MLNGNSKVRTFPLFRFENEVLQYRTGRPNEDRYVDVTGWGLNTCPVVFARCRLFSERRTHDLAPLLTDEEVRQTKEAKLAEARILELRAIASQRPSPQPLTPPSLP